MQQLVVWRNANTPNQTVHRLVFILIILYVIYLITGYPWVSSWHAVLDFVNKNQDISVGKNKRSRLLELLDKYVKPKRTRLSTKKKVAKSSSGPKLKTANSHRIQPKMSASKNHVDFARFEQTELVAMIKAIGMVTDGLDKNALINMCKMYADLSKFEMFAFSCLFSKFDSDDNHFSP